MKSEKIVEGYSHDPKNSEFLRVREKYGQITSARLHSNFLLDQANLKFRNMHLVLEFRLFRSSLFAYS